VVELEALDCGFDVDCVVRPLESLLSTDMIVSTCIDERRGQWIAVASSGVAIVMGSISRSIQRSHDRSAFLKQGQAGLPSFWDLVSLTSDLPDHSRSQIAPYCSKPSTIAASPSAVLCVLASV